MGGLSPGKDALHSLIARRGGAGASGSRGVEDGPGAGCAIRTQGSTETGGGGGRGRRGEVTPARLGEDRSPDDSEKGLPVLKVVILDRR